MAGGGSMSSSKSGFANSPFQCNNNSNMGMNGGSGFMQPQQPQGMGQNMMQQMQPQNNLLSQIAQQNSLTTNPYAQNTPGSITNPSHPPPGLLPQIANTYQQPGSNFSPEPQLQPQPFDRQQMLDWDYPLPYGYTNI